jgi:citrate lyase subunit beta/citryl-CoA lyase
MRSLLFVPADSERKLAKALGAGADALILDLEDSVALPRKEAARATARDFLRSRAAGPLLYVRINPLASGLAEADLDAVVGARPDGIMLPKCAGAIDVRRLGDMLDDRKAGPETRILPIVTETARALFTLDSFAAPDVRVAGLMWGAEDLAADVGAIANRRADGTYEPPFELARWLCMFAAAAAGIPAVDTVYADFRDLAGLEREARDGARLGFSAKAAIHPDQVAVINRVFTPDTAAVAWAKSIVAAFAASPEAGVVSLDGKMVDRPHLLAARRVLERAGPKA